MLDSLICQHVICLKAEIVRNPKRCTHLITGTPIKRSRKFFGAMRYARYIVNIQWLLESFKAGKFLSEKLYLIRDEEAERTWQFNLRASLVNRVRGGVFQQCQFFFCPGVAQASNFELNRIVEDANGKVITEVIMPSMDFINLISDSLYNFWDVAFSVLTFRS